MSALRLLSLLVAIVVPGDAVFARPPPHVSGVGVFDESSRACAVSYDGMVWYAVPAGSFSPIDVREERCPGSALIANPSPPIPAWARPIGPTHTVFVATSLQEADTSAEEAHAIAGMQSIESAAAPAHTPVTWLIGSERYLANTSLYDRYHRSNGDDVEAEQSPSLIAAVRSAFPWFRPIVSIGRAGQEPDIRGALALGETAFWGIAWNQAGVDETVDVGAPWGTYCADITSYKRPASDGSCSLLAFEWTARDLTRAYLSGHPEDFSTDPDDLQQRAGFDASSAARYARAIVDAYAAAGEMQPLVMMSQQESAEQLNPGDRKIMSALYEQARADGMHAETLARAATDARGFSTDPRAVAFPYIPGGAVLPSPVLDGGTLYPATIDYHDRISGMTFLAGHTLPTRVFRYRDDPVSRYDMPFAELPVQEMPVLTGVIASKGELALSFQAPVAVHYGVALWTNPQTLGVSGRGVTPAGRGGVVLTFDLRPGTNRVVFRCARCSSATFAYAT